MKGVEGAVELRFWGLWVCLGHVENFAVGAGFSGGGFMGLDEHRRIYE